MITIPFLTLLKKEVYRFMAIAVQTLVAPTITASLYLFIFGVGLGRQIDVSSEYSFVQFVIPGLILMGVINNTFGNISSSLFFSKYIGNIVDYFVMPLTPLQFILAHTLASMLRGLLVGVMVWLVSMFFAPLPWFSISYAIATVVLTSFIFSQLGIIAAIYSRTWDHLSVFMNFLIMPMVFLGGVFYPISILSGFWKTVSLLNPVYYLVDSFRYGALGVYDTSPWISLAFSIVFSVTLCAWATVLICKGYKIKN